MSTKKIPIILFDPSAKDKATAVRGVGRYTRILYKALSESELKNRVQLCGDLRNVPYDSLLINPFVRFYYPPHQLKKPARFMIGVIHDVIPYKYPTHFPIGIKGIGSVFLNKLLIHQYDTIITDSHASKSDILKMLSISEDDITVIYPGINIKILEENAKPPEDHVFRKLPEKYYLYVGDATWNKNLVTIARALKLANVTSVWVGKHFLYSAQKKALSSNRSTISPWLDELQTFYEETEGDNRFIFKGFVTDTSLTYLYRQAYANMLISRDEGFGLSYVESALQGTPSILGDTDIAREVAGETALFANTKDPIAIADTIKSLDDPALYDNLKNKLPRWLKRYSFRQFQKKLVDLCVSFG